MDLANVVPEDFDPYVGKTFVVSNGTSLVSMVLDNVKRFERSDMRDTVVEVDGQAVPPRRAFALTFEGPREPLLGQGTMSVEETQLGRFSLFLAPFRQDAKSTLYEAVFN